MALSTLHQSKTFYDPHYRPELAPSPGLVQRGGHCWFDDFSISEYLHVLKPQCVDVDPTAFIQDYPARNFLRTSASFSKVEASGLPESARALGKRSTSCSRLEVQSKCSSHSEDEAAAPENNVPAPGL